MKTNNWSAACLTAVLFAGAALAADLPRSDAPEQQGVSSSGLIGFLNTLDQQVDSMHCMMLVRHGKVVLEASWRPYHPSFKHELYSLSKSFTSTAVGLAISEGKLSLDDPILKFFPEDAPANPGENLKAMKIRHLLSMSTGHQTEPRVQASSQPWTKTFLAHPVPHKPGEHFLYNTAATYMLSAAVQKVTGEKVLDYLRPRLFDPLGIENPTWGTSPQGVSLGGYGLNIRVEDIAKFGQLYLQKGKWNGKQLVPAEWIDSASAKQVSNGSNPRSDWNQGYGYQFWRCRHNCFRGDGAFGQYCIVMPDQDAVLAITSGTGNMQKVLDVVWDKLLPAMHADSLPNASPEQARLNVMLKALTLKTPKAAEGATGLAGLNGVKFAFPSNDQKLEWVKLDSSANGGMVLHLKHAGASERKIQSDSSGWKDGKASFGPTPEIPASAAGAWTAANVFTMKVWLVETPFALTYRLTFVDGKLKLETESNVGFGPTKRPAIVGEPVSARP